MSIDYINKIIPEVGALELRGSNSSKSTSLILLGRLEAATAGMGSVDSYNTVGGVRGGETALVEESIFTGDVFPSLENSKKKHQQMWTWIKSNIYFL